jgi:hypothetical protein
MDCPHHYQRPDAEQKAWICTDCGASTRPLGTEAESEPTKDTVDGKPDL